MDTKKYEALVTAYECGSFTRAAELLGYTQSGLTQMMNRLESELELQLLMRGHYGTKLTSEGEALLPFIKEFLSAGEKLKKETERIKSRNDETIRIGSYYSISMNWLPTIMQRFHEDYPNVKIELIDGSRPQLYSWVLDSTLDIAFVSRTGETSVNWIPLKDDPLLAVLPPDYPEAQGMESFPVRLYQGVNFLMPSLGFDQDIEVVFDECDVEPQIQSTSVNDAAIISMVSRGLGVSMLTELVLKPKHDNVLTLPLSPNYCRHLGIITRQGRELNSYARTFIRYAEEVVETL